MRRLYRGDEIAESLANTPIKVPVSEYCST
jgi:hypothetical protein